MPLTDSSWPVKVGGSQKKRTGGSDGETRGGEGEEGGMEEDIPNSKRRAAFPWQLGSHSNRPAKDAISMKKYLLTLDCTVCPQTQTHCYALVPMCEDDAHSPGSETLTHLRSIMRAQLHATYVGSSVIGLAPLGWRKRHIVSVILLTVLFGPQTSKDLLQISLRGPSPPFIVSLTATVCMPAPPTYLHVSYM